MKVKIGNKWYSSDVQPICIQISALEQISKIDRTVAVEGKYAVFPNSCELTKEQMFQLME